MIRMREDFNLGYVIYDDGELFRLIYDEKTLKLFNDWIDKSVGNKVRKNIKVEEIYDERKWKNMLLLHPEKMLHEHELIKFIKIFEKSGDVYLTDILSMDNEFEFILDELLKLSCSNKISKKKRNKLKKIHCDLTSLYHDMMYLLCIKTIRVNEEKDEKHDYDNYMY